MSDDPATPTTSEHDALRRLLDERFSCRAYQSRAVPRRVIETLLETAQRTASWCNSQAWQVDVTSGAATERFREVLYATAKTQPMKSDIPEPSEYRGVYQDRRRAAGYGLYASLGIARDDRERRHEQLLENFRLFGAPHVAVIHSDAALGPYGYVDCGGYVANFLLAAQSLGIAAIPQAAIAMYSGVVRGFFQIPDDRVIVCGISFGYADAEHPVNRFRTEREQLDRVARFHV